MAMNVVLGDHIDQSVDRTVNHKYERCPASRLLPERQLLLSPLKRRGGEADRQECRRVQRQPQTLSFKWV